MSIHADDEVRSAIASVHNDASGVEWTVIGLKSKTELCVVACGTGGLSEVTPHLAEDSPAFAIIRYKLQIDKSSNVRFAFVDWTPDATPPMKKSFISTQKGNIKKLFEPYHVDLVASDNSDLNENTIFKKIGLASGTLDNIVEAKSEPAPKAAAPKPASSKPPTQPRPVPSIGRLNSTVKMDITNEDEFKAGLAAVRDANSEVTWFLAALNDKLALEVVGSGAGTVEDMLGFVREGTANYGLIRVVDVMDGKSNTLKFAYVVYLPDDVPPMKKGKINTISGNIKDNFLPVHVEFFVNIKEDLTQDQVEDKVKLTSGSKAR